MYNSNNKFKNNINQNNKEFEKVKNFRQNNSLKYTVPEEETEDELLEDELATDEVEEEAGNSYPNNYGYNNGYQNTNNDNNNEHKNLKFSNKKQLPKKPKSNQAVKKTANKAAKKTGSAVVKGLKSSKLFFSKYGIIIIIGALIIIFVLFLAILMCLGMFDSGTSGEGSGSIGLLSTYKNCDYITVDGEQIDFETYIAGVVTAENGNAAFPEAMKAQAVAARNYALIQTNYCQGTIKNSQANQVYKQPSEAALAAAKATENEVMKYSDGTLVPGHYASYPSGSGNWSYGSCETPTCNGTTCSVTLYKEPTGTKFTFEMDQYNDGNTWNGLELTNQAGHCYGMSQLGARYLDKQGYDYKEILSYFYDYEPASMKQSWIGKIIGMLRGYKERTVKPTSSESEWTNENIFYSSKKRLVGQCTWYAHGRALEILKNAGLSDSELKIAKSILNKMNGNAGTWYSTNELLGGEGFAYGDEPRVGAIIVWGGVSEDYANTYCPGQTYPEAGHVGIVERVKKDIFGNVTSLIISDGWKSGDRYSESWDTVNFSYNEWTMEKIHNYKNGCRPFKGYIYLLGEE